MDSYSISSGLSTQPALCSAPPRSLGLLRIIFHLHIDRLRRSRTRWCRLVVIFCFPVREQKRGCDTQRLNFFLQSRHIKLFLSQNFVNVLHRKALLTALRFLARLWRWGLYRPSFHFATSPPSP